MGFVGSSIFDVPKRRSILNHSGRHLCRVRCGNGIGVRVRAEWSTGSVTKVGRDELDRIMAATMSDPQAPPVIVDFYANWYGFSHGVE